MPKEKAQQRYTGEFKQKVVEAMREEHLSYKEAARKFGVKGLPPAFHRQQALTAA